MTLAKLSFPSAAVLVYAATMTITPAQASLIADGITYTLTETAGTATTDHFALSISGINGASDTEKGRYGVEAFAFNPPSNFSSAVAPSGFTFQNGGLNASGCNGTGNFFCFAANTTPTGPALSANSTLNFLFDLTVSSGSFAGYNPSFKINWDGTKNNYDLVSQTLTPTMSTPVPEPASLVLVATGLFAIAGISRWRKTV